MTMGGALLLLIAAAGLLSDSCMGFRLVRVSRVHRSYGRFALHSASDSSTGGAQGPASNATSDEDFEAMRAMIDAMVPSDIPTTELPPQRIPESRSRRDSLLIAAASFGVGVVSFFSIHNSPVSSIALLNAMEKDSMPMREAMCNGKPTVVDFYAYWCESCKVMAPSMRALEIKYRNDLNFVSIDGGDPANSAVVGQFRVDAIPHVAFVTPSAEVKTALVGAVPQRVLEEDMQALLKVSISYTNEQC